MRVHVFSDLHIEFGPLPLPAPVCSGALADLVLLAGDVHTRRRGPAWAAETFSQPVAMVAGNHESYGDSLGAVIDAGRREAAKHSVGRAHPMRFLECESWELAAADGGPVRVLGATFWTDFAVFGPEAQSSAMGHARQRMNDFQMIQFVDPTGRSRALQPEDVAQIHAVSRAFLEAELAKPFAGPTIVMTHHAPSLMSVPPQERDDPIRAAYAAAADGLIESYQPALWVHGHLHHSADYAIGKTRVVCNPRGYTPHHLNPGFDPELAIELG